MNVDHDDGEKVLLVASLTLGTDDKRSTPKQESLFLGMVELAIEVDKVLGEHVPVAREHPEEHGALLGVLEDGGLVPGVLGAVLLKVLGGEGPVEGEVVVVDD